MISNNRITHIDKNGDTSTQTVSNPTYDVFGNVIADNRPGTAADMTYTYDTLHGWLTGVSSPCGFSEQLLRETATNAQYSGNIGRMLWRNTANGEQHRYDYTYDTLGRLTSSQYSSSVNGTAGRFNESVTYNSNGSITSLLRNGMKNDGTFGAIDDLTITYSGNRLLKVTDDAETLNYNGALDFDDGDDSTTEYHYDGNGALTYDSNRAINKITYDYSHYPSLIARSTIKKTVYNDYTPEGRKLYSLHVSYFPKGNRTYYRISIKDFYIDDLILRSDTALLWRFSGGYVELNANSTPTSWNYYITDHLGSTRMVVGSDNSIKETINYYPFGSEMQMVNPALLTGGTSHPYRFTGKELDKVNNLNMYDFGARWYDVAGVPMWTSVDPLCEKYYNVSPYAYCANNPVNNIDIDGRDWFRDEDGSIQYNPDVCSQDDLGKGQVYLWETYNDKKAGINYRNDGSILFNNETAAYIRMWSQADKHYRTKDSKGGREVGGFILSDGKVLVLPDYANDAYSSYISKYDYKVNKDGTLSHGNETFNVLGNIHTHQERTTDPKPSVSEYGGEDLAISRSMGDKPVMTIGHDNKVYGIYHIRGGKAGQYSDFELHSRKGLLNGWYKIYPWLKQQKF